MIAFVIEQSSVNRLEKIQVKMKDIHTGWELNGSRILF